MSKKTFDEYYNTVCKQYKDMTTLLEETEEQLANKMISPEQVENLRKAMVPVQNSYATVAYIKYLLDQPTRNRKVGKYKKAQYNLIRDKDKNCSPEAVIASNQEALADMQNVCASITENT